MNENTAFQIFSPACISFHNYPGSHTTSHASTEWICQCKPAKCSEVTWKQLVGNGKSTDYVPSLKMLWQGAHSRALSSCKKKKGEQNPCQILHISQCLLCVAGGIQPPFLPFKINYCLKNDPFTSRLKRKKLHKEIKQANKKYWKRLKILALKRHCKQKVVSLAFLQQRFFEPCQDSGMWYPLLYVFRGGQ